MHLLNVLPAFLGVGTMHLTGINVAVIFVEWILLKRISKVSKFRGIFIILANLCSAFFGIITATYVTDNIGGNFWDGNIHEFRPRNAFIIGLVLFLAFTIIVESPFYYWAMRKEKDFRKLWFYQQALTCSQISLLSYFTM